MMGGWVFHGRWWGCSLLIHHWSLMIMVTVVMEEWTMIDNWSIDDRRLSIDAWLLMIDDWWLMIDDSQVPGIDYLVSTIDCWWSMIENGLLILDDRWFWEVSSIRSRQLIINDRILTVAVQYPMITGRPQARSELGRLADRSVVAGLFGIFFAYCAVHSTVHLLFLGLLAWEATVGQYSSTCLARKPILTNSSNLGQIIYISIPPVHDVGPSGQIYSRSVWSVWSVWSSSCHRVGAVWSAWSSSCFLGWNCWICTMQILHNLS